MGASDDSSGSCVGYLTSAPCLALAVGVEGRHLESIMRKMVIGNEVGTDPSFAARASFLAY